MTHKTYRSPCCDASVVVSVEVKRYYVCTGCGEACRLRDLQYEEGDNGG